MTAMHTVCVILPLRPACVCSFSPGLARPVAGSYDADTKTAGSCTLLVQQALPVLMCAHAAVDSDGDGTRCVFLEGGVGQADC